MKAYDETENIDGGFIYTMIGVLANVPKQFDENISIKGVIDAIRIHTTVSKRQPKDLVFNIVYI